MKVKQKAALSALLLALMTVFLSIELVYGQDRLGVPATAFHFHHGLTASVLTIWGLMYTAIAAVTAWRKIGLSHIAGVITSIALAQALFNTTTLYRTEAAIVSATLLVYVGVWALRRTRFVQKPLFPLFGITLGASLFQSIIYKILLPTYVLPGALIFKTLTTAIIAGISWAALNREDAPNDEVSSRR